MIIKEKKVPVFFYGSYMNFKVLSEVQLYPESYEVARLSGYEIKIHPRANIYRNDQHYVYGILTSATHAELGRLYAHAHDILGETYLPEAVLVETLEGKWVPAMCYIAHHMNEKPAARDYVDRIVNPAKEFKFPDWYIRHLESFAG